MLHSPYVYQVELYTPEGAAIGRAPLAVDWAPARECAWFESVRAGRLAADALEESATAVPIWHPSAGEPYVDGFRVAMTIDEDEVTTVFGAEYFATLARVALEALRSGATPASERHERPDAAVRYVTTAYRAADVPQHAAAPPFVAREVAPAVALTDRPIASLARDARPQGDPCEGELPVFVPREVLEQAARQTGEVSGRETGGILVGHLRRDPGTGEVFVEVTAQIPARHTESDATSLAFTAATWTDVQAAIALRAGGELMLGWWHSHPVREWCKACALEKQRDCSLALGFLSAHDRALHRAVFPRAYSLALVASDVAADGPRFALFGWQRGVLARRGFHLVGAE